MSAKKKPAVAAPQGWAEANALLEEYGDISNSLVRIEADLDAAVAKARKPFDDLATPLQERADAIFEGLELYADANRKTLTEDGKTKTVKMAAGAFGWRTCPPSVAIESKLKAKDVIKNILALVARLFKAEEKENRKLAETARGFIRFKQEVNREAMLAAPELAAKVKGVSIVTDSEEFWIDPTQAELAEPVS